MSFYTGIYSRCYDVIYSTKPYRKEVKFISKALRELGVRKNSNLLDLACGTGTHAVHFGKEGFNVNGVDISGPLLKVAREKARKVKIPIRFFRQDMTDLSIVRDESYDVVTCLFDSLGYLCTEERILKCLKQVKQKLRPGGLFVCEVWNSSGLTKEFEPLRIGRWSTKDGEIIRIARTRLHPRQHLAEVKYTLFAPELKDTYRKHEETQWNRYFSKEDCRQMLTKAGLSPVAIFPGYRRKAAPNKTVWHLLCISRKR